ncbi:MAG: hypothetical protein SAJ37_11540 [Oscillatoria sp. PMC 1068.18]|nr:hypothetical protein [Oscillatoria sp. PMC 1076.18]MEC4989372.1 hypothetical protein [Oscillatoria sp. PMC 1068.18]
MYKSIDYRESLRKVNRFWSKKPKNALCFFLHSNQAQSQGVTVGKKITDVTVKTTLSTTKTNKNSYPVIVIYFTCDRFLCYQGGNS